MLYPPMTGLGNHTWFFFFSQSDAYLRQWIKPCLGQMRLVACWTPSHYLNQCSHIVNWTLGNKFQWIQNTKRISKYNLQSGGPFVLCAIRHFIVPAMNFTGHRQTMVSPVDKTSHFYGLSCTPAWDLFYYYRSHVPEPALSLWRRCVITYVEKYCGNVVTYPGVTSKLNYCCSFYIYGTGELLHPTGNHGHNYLSKS